MAGTLFYYFGDDEAYYRALMGEFKKHTKLVLDFKRIYEREESRIQSLFLNVFKNNPAVVFIDFSKQTPDYMHLARIIARTPLDPPLTLVGLVDYLSPPEVLKECVVTGVQLIYIKSAEIYDVVFDIAKLIAPQELASHGFATATLPAEEWTVGVPAKIGYIQGDGLHLETDFKMSKGTRIKLSHGWVKTRAVPSQELFVKEVSQSNMFYHFKYNADLDFIFVDEFIPPEGMEEERLNEKVKEREESVLHHKKLLKKWIDSNLEGSLEKKAKLLIIDTSFYFYQNQPRTDKHPYTVRCVPYLSDIGVELARTQPQVIAFAMDPESLETKKNTNETLNSLVQHIKSSFGEEYRPFIIVFNTKIPSKETQTTLGYPFVMATDQEISVDVLMKMAEMFVKKMKAAASEPDKNAPVPFFIKKNNPITVTEILIPIAVIKLSETDIIFQTDSPIEIGMNLHVSNPVNMYVHVQPTKASGKVPEYYGLIHCLGEAEKKELRKYVNSVFFREHDAKLVAANAEFKKLNEDKLKQKMEQERLAAAAAAQVAEEKASEKAAKEADQAAKAAAKPEIKVEEPSDKKNEPA